MSGPPGEGVIRVAARLVPEARRRQWRQEWEAETAYAWQRLGGAGASSGARVQLWLRVVTCVIDAAVERSTTMKFTGMRNDVRFALRALLRRPGFTAVAVLTLGLGIGATTAVFTLLDGILLSPLPFADSKQLVSLQHLGREGQDELPMSAGLYRLYRDQAQSLESIGMYNATVGNLVVEGEPERITGRTATPTFFTALRVQAALGRTFREEEGRPGGAPVVLLSDAFWRSRFGGDASIVGRSLDLNGVSREVVGVLPAGFAYPDAEARFFIPLIIDEANAPLGSFSPAGVARAKPGHTVETVQRELQGIMARLPELVPGDPAAEFLRSVNIRARVIPLKQALVGDLSTTLWILFATVGIVLLIACANVANLLLVRAEGRQRELALRMALGAGRVQVMRSFMGESIVLAVTGGALALLVASLALRLTTSLIPTDLPRMAEVGIDLRVLGFTAIIALGCALFFGFLPLLRYGARDLSGQLREGARGATSGRERHRLRNALVVSQVALALVLLIGSGLLLRSFIALRSVDPGFEPDHVLTARITVPPAEVPEWQAADQFFRQLRDRLAALPGVSSAGLVSAVPLGGSGFAYGAIEVEDHPRGDNELPVFANFVRTGPGYFETLGIDILQGRGFEPGDGADRFRAVVVSKAFADQWWPGTSPLGRRLRFGNDLEEWYQIVGVVNDVRQSGLEEISREMVYFPLVVDGGGEYNLARTLDVVIRTGGDPLGFVSVLRSETRALNARIPIANPRTMDDVVRSATARTSFTMAMLGSASAIALLLGLVGIYGVISYVVSQRTREIGVRMALGASAHTVRTMVVRQGLALSGVGVGVGLVVAALLSRVMDSLLYGVRAIDPVTYAVVAAALVGVAMMASLIPAVRAASVDPSRALRTE